MGSRESTMTVASLCLLAPTLALAGLVHTLDARLEGAVAFRGGRVEVNGKAVAWESLLIAVRDARGHALSARDVVRLKTGEAWVVDALGLTAGKLTVRFPLFGERQLDVGQIATLDFVPGLPPASRERNGALYREKGEHVPGKVLWLDGRRIAVASPLGVLEIPRRDATRYVFANGARPSPPRDGEEVGLTDGSILHGRLTPARGSFELDHAVLGKLAIPDNALRSVVRRSSAVIYLAELAPSATADPLVVRSAAPQLVAYPPSNGSPPWLKGVRVAPKAVLSYRLPSANGSKRLFRADLRPVPGARGDIRLRVLAGGRALMDEELASHPASLSLELPSSADLAIEVDFGKRIRFPCGVTICDPHIVVR